MDTTDRHSARLPLEPVDPLAALRACFERPEGWIFFDGNSVGPMPIATREATTKLLDDWARLRRRGWAERDWIDHPSLIGDALAPMLGASEGEVIACDNTTVNLYKAAGHALAVNRGRSRIITQAQNFPTDLHILQGLVAHGDGRWQLETISAANELDAVLTDDVALCVFSHVDYKSSERWDMQAITAACHRVGALVVWDVSHSAGAVPVDVKASDADYVVSCGYKYLCTGPGGPALLYVRPDLIEGAWSPICGWMGHRDIYAFSGQYDAHPGIKRFLTGTPMVGANHLAWAAAQHYRTIEPRAIWDYHRLLSETMIETLETECGELGVEVTAPRDHQRRGGHLTFRAPGAGHAVEALIDAKVVASFRAPDSIRFGLSPIGLTVADVGESVHRLKTILRNETWRDPKYAHVSV